ncbi:hypothetical protein CN918_27335 [Priestia megaterium]|nr:hypothetical protein CN918_27335 [Priestia megaterium]
MINFSYKKDENFVDITGVIQKLPPLVKYSTGNGAVRPIIQFDLLSQRERKSADEEIRLDLNRIILFDHETFPQDYAEGQRIRIKGVLQSRNYTLDFHLVEQYIIDAVRNYVDVFGEIPSIKETKFGKREPIDWKKLLSIGFIKKVPEDSMFTEDNTKEKSAERNYLYRVDENGDVFKETEHVAFEIISSKVEPVEQELAELEGDKNKVILTGKVITTPYFDMLGQTSRVPFCSFRVRTQSRFFGDKRAFHNNVISWAHFAEDAFANLQVGDIVKVIGRLQSRSFDKDVTYKYMTEHGNKKKKKVTKTITTHEVSVSKFMKADS